LSVPPEILNLNATIEKFRGKMNFAAENSNRRLEGERLRRKFGFPRENLTCQRNVEGVPGKLKSSAEE
jgi:hypothetical protein